MGAEDARATAFQVENLSRNGELEAACEVFSQLKEQLLAVRQALLQLS